MFDRERAFAAIAAGWCPCEGCRGRLADAGNFRGWRHCQVCRCAWKVETINGTDYAASIKGPLHTPARQPLRQLSKSDYDGHEDLL